MASFRVFFNTLVQSEGGYVDDPDDGGGPTKYGVTLKEWVRSGYDKDHDGDIDKDDVKLLTLDDAYMIAKKDYWDVIQGDLINNQSVANFIFDWSYISGSKTAIKYLQKTLKVDPVDGMIGNKTLSALNGADQETLFNALKSNRAAYFEAIVAAKPSQEKFLKGWLKRNNSFKFTV